MKQSVTPAKLFRVLFLCMFACVAYNVAQAQAPSATLVGQVTDVSKAVIPGATITVTNLDTNHMRTATSTGQGEYTLSNLEPGNYRVSITKAGFDAASEAKLELQADQTARLDVNLKIGDVSTMVTVNADIGLLNTETSTKGDVITPLEIAEIPLNGRDFNDLAFTVAGVQPAEKGAKGAPYVANGSRADSSGVYIDGINDENPRDAGSQISPPLDSIQEFRIETSDYTAQYGRLTGSVVNITTRSGGNRLHGSIFEYLRNDYLDAKPYNFTTVEVSKTKLRKNQFGGDLSGPIWVPHLYNGHDRSFFQLSLESTRTTTGGTSLSIVPTALERVGDFSQSNAGAPYYFHNPAVSTAVLCAPPAAPAVPTLAQVAGCLYAAPYYKITNIDPVAQKLLAYYPLPNIPGAAVGTNNFSFVSNKLSNNNNGLVRLDQRLSEKDQLTGRFIRNFSRSTTPTSGSNLGNFGSHTTNHQTLFGLGETRVFSQHLVNDFRLGRTRTVSAESNDDGGTNFALQLGISGTTTDPKLVSFPSFKPSGFGALGDNSSDPIAYVVNDYDGSDIVSYNRGRHNFRFGADILHVQLFQPTNTSKNGAFTYNGKFTSTTTSNALADLLAGYPATSVLLTGGATNHLLQTNYAGFGQDDWKVTPKLTLNLGLRYELQTLPSEQNGQLSNFVPSLGKIVYSNSSSVLNIGALLTTAGLAQYYVPSSDAGYPTALIHVNPARFSPRVGFAMRPFDNDKTVIRGGYGIFYTGIRLTVIRTNLAGQFPFATNTSYTAVSPGTKTGGSAFISSTNPFASSGGSLSGILTPNGYDPNAPSGQLQAYNLTLERQLGWGLAMEASYVGSKGTHLPQEYDYNQERVSGSTASRPLPLFSAITIEQFNGISHYDAAQFTVRRRFEKGLFFRVNYTYAKSLDSQSGANAAGSDGYFANQNVLNPNAEYGRSDFDIRHNFSGTGVYRARSRFYVLRDWQASGTVLAYSGLPFTPKVSGTQDLGQATRPNQSCSGVLANRSKTQWFDATCFSVPAAGTFGSAGRNIISAPGSTTLNLALGRIFSVAEYGKFEFRLEAFNALNHPNFSTPSATIGSSTTAGVISGAGNMRQVQLSGRYSF